MKLQRGEFLIFLLNRLKFDKFVVSSLPTLDPPRRAYILIISFNLLTNPRVANPHFEKQQQQLAGRKSLKLNLHKVSC